MGEPSQAEPVSAQLLRAANKRARESKMLRFAADYISALENAVVELGDGSPDRDGVSMETSLLEDKLREQRLNSPNLAMPLKGN